VTLEAPPSSRAPIASVGYLDLLRSNHSFRRLWLAEIISYLGDWFDTIALYTAVGKLSGSTEAMSTVFVAKTLPVFLMMPIAGPLIDRFDRKRLLIVADLARALGALLLVVGYRLASLPLLIGTVAMMVAFSGIFMPTKIALLPAIAQKGELGTANALAVGTWSVMLAIGAAIGGLFTNAFGIEASFVCDGATFVVSALLLSGLPRLLPEKKSGESKSGGFAEGIGYLLRRPYLAGVLSLKSLMSLSACSLALLPLFASRLFGGGAWETGALYAARGFGALAGSMWVRKLGRDDPRVIRGMIIPLLAVSAAGFLGLWRASRFDLALAACFVCAVGTGTIWAHSSMLAQLASDDAFRGRVFSIEFGVMTLIMSGSAAAGGALVDRWHWPLPSTAWLSAASFAVPTVVWALVLAFAPIEDSRRVRQRVDA
jgi:MFS family permease